MKSVIGVQFWAGFLCGAIIGPLLIFSFLKKVGTAPEVNFEKLELTDLEGNTFLLPSSPMLLNLWGTWCKPCVKELPDLNALNAEFSSMGISIIAISDEPLEIIREFREKKKLTVPMVKLTSQFSALGLGGVPTSYLIDKSGKIVYAKVGILKPENARFKKALEKLRVGD